MRFINTRHIKSAVLGFIVGDALGVPYEFKERDTFRCDGMNGHGTYDQVAGTWSDDSSMMLATLDSFLNCDGIDYRDIMRRFVEWLNNGEYCPHGVCFDAGFTTSRAIKRYDGLRDPRTCGGRTCTDNGNGSLMRILPIAFIPHETQDIYDLSSLTHGHGTSLMCCRVYIRFAENLMKGMTKEEAISALTDCTEECENIPRIASFKRDDISSSGYVADTLEAAIWSFMTTDNYRDCVTTAVELGEDTDTVAAIAGALAGIYYGIGGDRGIPEEWIDMLAKKEWIMSIADAAVKNA